MTHANVEAKRNPTVYHITLSRQQNNDVRAPWTHRLIFLACLLVGSLLGDVPAAAQLSGQTPPVFDGIGIDERLGAYVPKSLVFRDEQGEAVEIGSFFDDERPVLLTLAYHDCPMLCSVLLGKLTEALRAMTWTPGAEFEVLTVSFNAVETPELARRQKARYLAQLDKPDAAAGWHFLTGDEASINRLTEAVGFNYRWVEQQQEFVHPAALIFLGGDGQITRYLPGLEYSPRNICAALVEASEGTIGTALDQIFLFCFRYDPQANSYVLQAIRVMQIGGTLTALALGAMLFVFWRREVRRKHALS